MKFKNKKMIKNQTRIPKNLAKIINIKKRAKSKRHNFLTRANKKITHKVTIIRVNNQDNKIFR